MQQAPDLSEKLAESYLCNFHRTHIFLKLKIKMLLRKISSINLTAEVFFVVVVVVICALKVKMLSPSWTLSCLK